MAPDDFEAFFVDLFGVMAASGIELAASFKHPEFFTNLNIDLGFRIFAAFGVACVITCFELIVRNSWLLAAAVLVFPASTDLQET